MPGAVLFVPSLWCCPGWLGDSGSVGGGCVCAHIGPALPTWLCLLELLQTARAVVIDASH